MNDDIMGRHHRKIIQMLWTEDAEEALAFVIVDEDFRGEHVEPLADSAEVQNAPESLRVTVA